MRNVKVGDMVNVHDGSYSFGCDGEFYSNLINVKNRKGLRVIRTGLSAMEHARGSRDEPCPEVNNLLVTNGKGGFWFTQERFVHIQAHKIIIDGKTIEVSDESYQNLRAQLT